MGKNGLNKVMLIGNLGMDPEIRSTPSGQSVANFRMARCCGWKLCFSRHVRFY